MLLRLEIFNILTCFVAPPTNQSTFHQWTIGPIFYSILAMPEILGNTNTSRVVDLFANSNNDATPAYAIYENDQLARVALFNYMTDPTGAMALNVAIQVGGGNGQPASTPSQVKVKYLVADSVSEKFNITWAGRVSSLPPQTSFSLLMNISTDLRRSIRIRWPPHGRRADPNRAL